MATRRRRRPYSVGSLLVMRTLLIANGVLITVVGLMCLLYVDRPSGPVLGVLAWVFAATLFSCVPLTDPYRRERRR